MTAFDLEAREGQHYVIRHCDRVIGEVVKQGIVWKTLPTGSSTWTLHPWLENAAMHCLEFVGWADREAAGAGDDGADVGAGDASGLSGAVGGAR